VNGSHAEHGIMSVFSWQASELGRSCTDNWTLVFMYKCSVFVVSSSKELRERLGIDDI